MTSNDIQLLTFLNHLRAQLLINDCPFESTVMAMIMRQDNDAVMAALDLLGELALTDPESSDWDALEARREALMHTPRKAQPTRTPPLERMRHYAQTIGRIGMKSFTVPQEVAMGDTFFSRYLLGTLVAIGPQDAVVEDDRATWHVNVENLGYNPDSSNWTDFQDQHFREYVAAHIGELLGDSAFEEGDAIVVRKGAVPEFWFSGTYLGIEERHHSGSLDLTSVNVTFFNSIKQERQERIVGAWELGYPSLSAQNPRQQGVIATLLRDYHNQFQPKA